MTPIERATAAVLESIDITDGLTPQAAEKYVRAALAAVREPTGDMMVAALNIPDAVRPGGALGVEMDRWRAMIDQLLAYPSIDGSPAPVESHYLPPHARLP